MMDLLLATSVIPMPLLSIDISGVFYATIFAIELSGYFLPYIKRK